MNTAKIAALYPYFLDACRYLHTGRTLEDMLSTVLSAQQLQAKDPADFTRWVKLQDLDNPVTRFDELGLPMEEHLRLIVPVRVFEWVSRQRPAELVASATPADLLALHRAYLTAQTGWQVTANEVAPTLLGRPGEVVTVAPDKGRYHQWTGSAEQLAPVLRGIYAFQAKRRKQVRRLLAQLWAYHQQLQAAHVAQALEVATPAAPTLVCPAPGTEVNCAALNGKEWQRRTDAAEDLEEQLQQRHGNSFSYGREIMWHPLFPAEYLHSLSRVQLHESNAWQEGLANWANQDRPLDFYDYAYLADLLREALASQPTELSALRLRRALSWVEQAGQRCLAAEEQQPVTRSRPAEQPAPQVLELALAA